MGDPVTTGILIGAAMGGGTAAIKGDDPLKGALIGGATGGIGGGLSGGFGAGAGTGGGFAGGGYGSVGTAGQTALAGSSGGMFSGMTMPSTLTGIGQDISAANTFMNQNPTTSQIGFGLARDLMAPDQPIPYAQPGQIQRGQIAPMDYMSLLNPQGQSVMRPQPISLL
jgi:hypothetical protein